MAHLPDPINMHQHQASVSPIMTGHMLCSPKFGAAVSVPCQPLCCAVPSAALSGRLAPLQLLYMGGNG